MLVLGDVVVVGTMVGNKADPVSVVVGVWIEIERLAWLYGFA